MHVYKSVSGFGATCNINGGYNMIACTESKFIVLRGIPNGRHATVHGGPGGLVLRLGVHSPCSKVRWRVGRGHKQAECRQYGGQFASMNRESKEIKVWRDRR